MSLDGIPAKNRCLPFRMAKLWLLYPGLTCKAGSIHCPPCGHTYLGVGVRKCFKEQATRHRPVCSSVADETESVQVEMFNTIHCLKKTLCRYLLTCNIRLHTFVHASHLPQPIELITSPIHTPVVNIYMCVPVPLRNAILCVRLQVEFAQGVYWSGEASIFERHPFSLYSIAPLQSVARSQLMDVFWNTAAFTTSGRGHATAATAAASIGSAGGGSIGSAGGGAM